jgi:serine/threonine protein kinase
MTGLEGLLAGRVLGGRYLIEEVIGRGGMGAVYRARDERLGREVAIKVITVAGAEEPEMRERLRARFHREARSAAALPHHPNVVPVYDYGTDEALGLDYIVMELLRGGDLATRLARSGPPPLLASQKILHHAARGLAMGHRAGLIHRDVKPGNIFLAQTDQNEIQVRVVDFGIAKLADEQDTGNQLTQDGRVPHSPAYASPEQLRGLSNLTPASDVFSLGAVGYQLLTGERPYTESDRNRMALGMPVTPPSVRKLNPAVPAAVEAVITRALAFDPEDRYPDAGAMAAALDAAIRQLPDAPIEPYGPSLAAAPPAAVPTPPPAAAEDETRLIGEEDHTLLAPGAAQPGAPAPPPPRAAPPPRREPPQERRRSLAPVFWTLALLVVIAAVGLWAWQSRNGAGPIAAAPEPDTTAAADSQAQDTAAQAYLRAVVLNHEGVTAYTEGRYDDALPSLQQAVELAPDSAGYHRHLALTLIATGDPAEAERELQEALRLDPGLTIVYANLAQAQLARYDTAAAISSLERYVQRAPQGRARELAEQQLRVLKANRAGLLGVPLDTAADTVRQF